MNTMCRITAIMSDLDKLDKALLSCPATWACRPQVGYVRDLLQAARRLLKIAVTEAANLPTIPTKKTPQIEAAPRVPRVYKSGFLGVYQ